MGKNFADAMSKKTDAELVLILTERQNDYQPDAVTAAELEFKKRNLSETEVNKAKEQNEIQKQIDAEKANKELDSTWKILTLFFPGLLQLLIAGILKAEGYDRKSKELSKWTVYGFGLYVGIVFFFIILSNIILG